VNKKTVSQKRPGGLVCAVRKGSPAAKIGIRPGDFLLEVNGHPVADVIDVRFHAAEDVVRLMWRRGNRVRTGEARRPARAGLGLDFAHPTFDTEIRLCNNRCPFCFVLQLPPGMRRSLRVKDDDYRYSFLYGYFVTLTNLGRRDWDRILAQRLSPLYVSVHATERAVRAEMLGNPKAGDILERLRFLADGGIRMHTQVVLAPGMNDGGHLERTLDDLAALHPAVLSCSVVPVGVTRFQKHGVRPYSKAEKGTILDRLEVRREGFLRALGSRFVFPADEWYLAAGRTVPPREAYEGIDLRENGAGLVRDFLEDWEGCKRRLADSKSAFRFRRATLLTGRLFHDTLSPVADEFGRLSGIPLRVIAAGNCTFGPAVTVAGLLTGADVIGALREGDWDAPLLLPRVMFGSPPPVTLDGLAPRKMADRMGGKAFLVETMSDVYEVLAGKTLRLKDPG
jgi:putative radical SAM enzyme (TIGR03279 family)